MAISEKSCNLSLIPIFLYSSFVSPKSFTLEKILNASPSVVSSNVDAIASMKNIFIHAPAEPFSKIEMYSPAFNTTYTTSGILNCGLTHMVVTHLDLVKCNMQIDPTKYKSITSGFRILLKEQGVKGFFRGWVPTLLGYSVHGACKFGFYEFFKKYYSDIAGPEFAIKYKTLIYLVGSASSEVIVDITLCPFEAVKVRGLVPLWGRQIPYTMMMFASFETIVEIIYKYGIPTPKEQCNKNLQLGVSFADGYVAGVFYAIVSHRTDNLAVKKIGVVGLLTRGLPLRIVMIGTLTEAQWGIYDVFKVFLLHFQATGGV
ncbi:hypothetical protein UlMin_020627 [Ulmus minor]